MVEQTFKAYTAQRAKVYASSRGEYCADLYQVILDHHGSSGGQYETLVDLGCGPGNSTRPIARYFNRAFGVDQSPGMIEAAMAHSQQATDTAETKRGDKITFLLHKCETVDCDLFGGPGSVDLMMAGMAVHWFDMPLFWQTASKAVRSGGTVALWANPGLYCHPSTPDAARVQEVLDRLQDDYLKPFERKGNRLSRDYYKNLPMPWDSSPPAAGFSQKDFRKTIWDKDGKLSSSSHFFLNDEHMTLQELQENLSTLSMVTRWKEAYPTLVGTSEDVVLKTISDIRSILGKEDIVVGTSCVLLLFTKR